MHWANSFKFEYISASIQRLIVLVVRGGATNVSLLCSLILNRLGNASMLLHIRTQTTSDMGKSERITLHFTCLRPLPCSLWSFELSETMKGNASVFAHLEILILSTARNQKPHFIVFQTEPKRIRKFKFNAMKLKKYKWHACWFHGFKFVPWSRPMSLHLIG